MPAPGPRLKVRHEHRDLRSVGFLRTAQRASGRLAVPRVPSAWAHQGATNINQGDGKPRDNADNESRNAAPLTAAHHGQLHEPSIASTKAPASATP